MDWKGQDPTHGIEQPSISLRHMSKQAEARRRRSPVTRSRSGPGNWTCVVGEFESGGRMVTAELWSQFVLTYTPTNQTRDGKERNLRIDVADTFDNIKRVVRIKETYVGAQSK